jgi:hypothetical protein
VARAKMSNVSHFPTVRPAICDIPATGFQDN